MRLSAGPIASILCLAAMLALPAAAQLPAGKNWSEQKCERYTKAWTELMARRSRTGLSERFLADHARFLASGCSEGRDVCPRSPEEFELANIMVMAAMNAGTAGTFPPFACRN